MYRRNSPLQDLQDRSYRLIMLERAEKRRRLLADSTPKQAPLAAEDQRRSARVDGELPR